MSHKLAAFAIVPLVVAIVVLASGVPTGTMALDASNAAGANAPDTTRPLVRPTSGVLAVPTTTPTTTASPHVNATTTTATTAAAPARPSDHPVRIRVGDTTFEVGEVGDDVAVADWLCTGEPAAVLLRRSTGEVFLFAALPDSGEAFTGRLLEVVHDAASIVPQRTDATCPILAIADHTGATHEIGAR